MKQIERAKIETALRNYHWMVKEIARLRELLGDAGERVVRQYGIDSDMPKPKGGNTDPVYQESLRRERSWKRLRRLEEKVLLVQDRIDLITDEREKTVLDCMLDGMSMIGIARHMGLSERHIHRIKNSIVGQMAGMAGMSAKLPKRKICV